MMIENISGIRKTISKVIITAACTFLLWSCSEQPATSPEQQVKQIISNIESALEQRNLSDVFSHVSDEYRDHKGNDKKALRKIAQLYFLRHQNIELITTIQNIEPVFNSAGDVTTVGVEANVVMASKSSQGSNVLTQLRADTQTVSAAFSLQDEEWKLSSISWEAGY